MKRNTLMRVLAILVSVGMILTTIHTSAFVYADSTEPVAESAVVETTDQAEPAAEAVEEAAAPEAAQPEAEAAPVEAVAAEPEAEAEPAVTEEAPAADDAATEDADPAEEGSQEEDASAEETQDEESSEDAASESEEEAAPSEEEESDDAKADETESDDAKSDEAATEEAKSDDTKSDDAKADEDKEADKPAEVKMPAQNFKGGAGGMTVVVAAPEGAFPEGTKMVVTSVNDQAVLDQIAAGVDGEVEKIKAVDITFKNAEGKEIEPLKPISVVMKSAAISEDSVVMHMDDNGKVEEVNADVNASKAAFTSDDFSIYAVVETGDNARLTVNYVNGTNTIATTIVKKSDIDAKDADGNPLFDQIVYDPGVGELEDGTVFRGWTTKKEYTTADIENALTIDDIRTDVKAKLNAGVTDGDEVSYYAMIFNVMNVTFKDEIGVVIKFEGILTLDDTITYYVDEAYTPKTADQEFQGWYFTSAGTVKDGDGNVIPEGGTIPNESNVTIESDLILSAKAPTGAWLIFKENAKGATYTSPQFLEGTPTVEPADPQLFGYDFGGWYLNAECTGDQFVFGSPISTTTTLYAKWTPKTTAPYNVIIWKQNVSGTGYDFADSIQLTGNVNSTINTVVQNGANVNTGTTPAQTQNIRVNGTEIAYTGFHCDHFDSNVTIVAEGTSVLNVYYNRNLITINFNAGNGNYILDENDNTYKTNVSYTGLFESPLTFTWPTRSYTNAQGTGTGSATLWHYGTGWGTDLSFLGTFKLPTPTDVTLNLVRTAGGNYTKNFYQQNADGSWPTTAHESIGMDSQNFNVTDKYAGFYAYEWKSGTYSATGWTRFGNPSGGSYGTISGNTLHIRFARVQNRITYMDGVYVDGDNNPIDEINRGELHQTALMNYEKDVTSYAKGGADYYEPTFAGYAFEGWYADKTCTTPYTFTTMPADGITVYAKWRQTQYRVFLHPNVPTSDASFSMGGQNTCFRVDYGEQINAITGVRDEYELVGWYTDSTLKKAFNFDAFVLNDTTVTTAYDQTQSTELDKYGNPTANTNQDAIEGRFWVKKKIDLYAKWRSKIIGAEGITVIYEAGDGKFADGTATYTDPLLYKDDAGSVATGATTPNKPAEVEFDHWELLKWNGSDFVHDADVLPGDNFKVFKANSQVTENPDSTEEVPSYTYTIKLKAVYKPIQEEVLTHIDWYANNGTDAVKSDDKIRMNQPVDIEPATLYTYEGFEFVGWARWPEGSKPASPTDATNLWLVYDKANNKFTENGEDRTQVAADEKYPYHNLYAVWRAYPSITLEASKVFTGRDWKDTDSFTFTLQGGEGAPMPKEGTTVTFTKADQTKKSFGEIIFQNATVESVYTYTIAETSTLPGGVTKSDDITVEVTFTANNDGSLTANAAYTPENATITNTYRAVPVVVDPTKTKFGIKNVTSTTEDGKGHTFTFYLESMTEGAPLPEGGPEFSVAYEADETGEKDIPFGTITYNEVGTYKYKIYEQDPGTGWTTTPEDGADVTVKITDNGEGALVAEVTPGTIANAYKPGEIIVDPSKTETAFGKKNVTAAAQGGADKEFSFTLKALTEGAPMPSSATAKLSYAAKETGEKVIPFGEITFEKTGIYTYEISETAPGKGWTVNGSPATVVVTISDKGDGTLSASVEAGDSIENEYKPDKIVVDPTDTETTFGKKNLTATTEDNKAQSFEFTLAAVTEGAPMPAAATATVNYAAGEKGEKVIPFGEITYTAAGEYEYTITEASKGAGWTTTGSGEKIKVTITDNGDGTLSAAVDTKEITNTYKPGEIVVDPTNADTTFGKKSVTAAAQDGKTKEFTFTLAAVTEGAPMPETATAKVSYDSGETGIKTIPFDKITYNKAGEYKYTITEAAAGDGWTTTSSPATVTVTVTDNGDGTLSATTAYQTIINSYAVEEIVVNPTDAETTFGKKNLTATTKDGKAQSFEFTLAAVTEGAPMPTPATAKVDYEAGKTGEKVIPFGEITYTAAGTYEYTITEKDAGAGWTTNGSPATVKVIITDNGDGTLSAAVEETATITNKYAFEELVVDPTDAATEYGRKNVPSTTKDGKGHTFTFYLESMTEGAPLPEGGPEFDVVYAADETGEKVIPFGKITYDEVGTYTYKIYEKDPGAGWTTTPAIAEGADVTVTITDNGDGTLKAEVTGGKITNEYKVDQIIVDTDDVKTTVGKKTVVGNGFDETTFDFTIEAKDGAPAPSKTSASVKATAAGDYAIDFGEITFKEVGEYTYTVTETTTLSNGWTSPAQSKDAVIKVTDNGDGTLSAEVTGVTIQNNYKANDVIVDTDDAESTLAQKTVTGKGFDETEFAFTVEANEDDAPAATITSATVTAKAAGTQAIDFGTITFSQPGTYTYTITETTTLTKGWTRDAETATATVTVTDNGQGQLVAEVETAMITNNYKAEPVEVDTDDTEAETVLANKTVEGTGFASTDFEFSVEAKDGAPEATKTTGKVTATAAGTQAIDFGTITFTEVGTYTYTIKETSTLTNGWSCAATEATATVTVTDDGKGQLVAEVQTAEITNKYKANDVTVDTDDAESTLAKKIVEGTGFASTDFEFSATAAEGAPAPTKTTGKVTATAAGSQAIDFGMITFSEVGTYTYTIKETSTLTKGWKATATEATATVTVTDDGKGQLVAAVETAEITNTYKAEPVEIDTDDTEAETVIANKTVKIVNGTAFNSTDFEFTAKADADDSPAPTSENGKVTATEEGTQAIDFGTITFTKPGTYTYTVEETTELTKGWSRDVDSAKATVVVTDDGKGQLVAEVTTAEITNTYEPEPVEIDTDDTEAETVIANKIAEGEGFNAKEFAFNAAANEEGAPAPTTAEASVKVEEAGTQAIDFGTITFTKPGTYTYTVEETTELPKGWKADPESQKATATVIVTDDGAGQLVAEVKTAEITNTYKAEPVEIDTDDTEAETVLANKIAEGEGFNAKEFAFTAAANEDDAPAPTITEASVEVKEAGTQAIDFGKITFTEVGTYTYTITETTELTKGWTRDVDSATATVTVTDDGEGQLVAEVETAEITNSYKPEPVVVITDDVETTVGQKTVLGEKFEAADFSFSLTAEDGAPEPSTAEATITAKKAGDFVLDFGEITFEEPGTYTYTLTETSELTNGWNCDETEATATITVTDDGEGQLVAEVETATITNRYKVYTIKFDPNGGTVRGTKEVYTLTDTAVIGDVITIIEAPEREGYKFLYWKGSEYQPGDKYTVEGDHTFVAQWEKATTPTPTPTPEPTKQVTPKTGDSNNMLPFMVAICVAALLLILGVIVLIKRRREDA